MRARRFQAGSVGEAYEQVRSALGDDAVIISTRQAVAPGMFGFGKREFVEVVAGLPDEADPIAPFRPLVQDAAAHDLVRGLAEQAAARGGLDISLPVEPLQREPVIARRRTAPEPELAPPFVNALAGAGIGRGGPFDVLDRIVPAESAAPVEGDSPVTKPAPRRRTKASTGASPTLTEGIGEETLTTLAAGLRDVRSLVERIALERANADVDRGPQSLIEVRAQLMEQGLTPTVLVPLLDSVASSLLPNASTEAARQAVERRLAAQLPAPVTVDVAKRPTTLFIVGPSGSGKTTAGVRLGLQFLQQGLRVTVVGTDVDRAGAPQQLQAYATAIGLGVRICYTPGELQALIAEGNANVVIVDTAGHNGSHGDRMAELQAFMQVVRERTVLLTLPATMQGVDLQRITQAYAPVHPHGLVLTRCDETAAFGGLVSTVAQSAVGVAYTMHGDAVDDPARAGDNHALAASTLLGEWPERTSITGRGRRAG